MFYQKRKIRYNIIALLLLAFVIFSGCDSGAKDQDLNIYCFQAGKADAFILYTDNATVLIDCGNRGFGQPILEYLTQKNIDHLDYLIITHFDKDHVGGAAEIINAIPVNNVLQNDNPKESKEYDKYIKALDDAGLEPETVNGSVKFSLDGTDYYVKSADRIYEKNDSNNSSLITSVIYGGKKFIFTGDIESERIKDFVRRNRYHYDLIKVPHHGGKENQMEDLIKSVKPHYAIITSSDIDKEEDTVVSVLEKFKVSVFMTRISPILITSDGVDINIEYIDN